MKDLKSQLDRLEANLQTSTWEADQEILSAAPALLAAVREVLELHRKIDSPLPLENCEECETCTQPWPCPTVQAIERLGGVK